MESTVIVFLGFFNMWGFGRVNKQASQPVKKQENTTSCSLVLIGDLIGHSSSVEVLFSTDIYMFRELLILHLPFMTQISEPFQGIADSTAWDKIDYDICN